MDTTSKNSQDLMNAEIDSAIAPEQKNSSKAKASRVSNKTSKANNASSGTQAKAKSSSTKSSTKTKPVKNDNLSLPWSCTLGLVNIAKLDSLETIYHLKNRDAALSLIINSPKTLKQLVNKKGANAKKLFDSNYNLFITKHKGKAKKHYDKFYTSQRYKN